MTSSHGNARTQSGFFAFKAFAASALLLGGCNAGATDTARLAAAAPKTSGAPAVPKVSAVPAAPSKPLLMAHYMPWYSSKEGSGQWGWHWTMNHFKPDAIDSKGRRPAASQYRPLIGLYDSGDADALQCQVMLMKLSGIDGVIIDWYGKDEFLDYGINHRNTQKLIPYLQQAGLRFALCYEDQTIPKEIAGKVFPAENAVAHTQELMRWVEKNFFANPAYVKIGDRPVFLTFGEPYFKDAQWNEVFSVLKTKPLYFTEHGIRAETAAIGAFDWPIPRGGTAKALADQVAFNARAKSWPLFVAAAFPRFHDIYVEAGVHESWGKIEDQAGRTYTETLSGSLGSGASIVQLVTWNDWGEGTQIEPSVEFGYRDLEATQKLRKQHIEPSFSQNAKDLRLPVEWYLLKKKNAANPAATKKLATFFPLMAAGRIKEARALLSQYKK